MNLSEPDPTPFELAAAVTARSGYTSAVGTRVVAAEAGAIELALDKRADLLQFNGFFHGGVIAGLADHAAGGAVSTALPPGRLAVTVDLHVTFLAPADGDLLVARAKAVQVGSTICVATVDVATTSGDGERRPAPSPRRRSGPSTHPSLGRDRAAAARQVSAHSAEEAAVTAYALAQISIHDHARYDRYAKLFMGVLAGFGGRLLAADESPEVLEGTWPYDKVVLIEFPDRDQLERWSRSPEYTEIAADRIAATTGCVLVVSGLSRPADA